MPSSTVCLIAKNEGPYLLEWVAYYRILGFDNIVIYENNSTDDSAKLLSTLAKRHVIEHRPWRLGVNESPQISAYRDAITRASTPWLLFVDCDEFLVFHSGTLKSLLEHSHARRDVSAIGVNWRIFGSSRLKEPDNRPVTERFTLASTGDFHMNNHLKSFLRVDDVGDHIDMHLSDVRGRVIFPDNSEIKLCSRGRSELINHHIAQINHYYCKTYEEYKIKRSRGQAGASEQSEIKYCYDDNSFNYHDRNDEQDLSAVKMLQPLKREIDNLNSIINKKNFVFGWRG